MAETVVGYQKAVEDSRPVHLGRSLRSMSTVSKSCLLMDKAQLMTGSVPGCRVEDSYCRIQ